MKKIIVLFVSLVMLLGVINLVNATTCSGGTCSPPCFTGCVCLVSDDGENCVCDCGSGTRSGSNACNNDNPLCICDGERGGLCIYDDPIWYTCQCEWCGVSPPYNLPFCDENGDLVTFDIIDLGLGHNCYDAKTVDCGTQCCKGIAGSAYCGACCTENGGSCTAHSQCCSEHCRAATPRICCDKGTEGCTCKENNVCNSGLWCDADRTRPNYCCQTGWYWSDTDNACVEGADECTEQGYHVFNIPPWLPWYSEEYGACCADIFMYGHSGNYFVPIETY